MKIFTICLCLMNLSLIAQKPCGVILHDNRDGASYQTVQIGDQCWMAENLNIGEVKKDHLQSDNNVIEKTCYENDLQNCSVYGGLYTWDEMMQYENIPDNDANAVVQGICPEGWRIPNKKDWEQLSAYLGVDLAGQKIKASKTDQIPWDGTNETGFSALPAGAGNTKYFHRINSWALFWTATPADHGFAWFAQLDSYWYKAPPKYPNIYIGNYYRTFNGFSVRCIKE